jgi:uncharacterized protein YndB with AHSA1/START domain
MHTFTVTVRIEAPPAAVWTALADIGTISEWNPGVIESALTSERASGVGATRYCDLGGRNYLEESVETWEENRTLTMRIDRTNLPFAAATIRFALAEEGDGTVVAVTPEYRLQYGLLGRLLDRIYVRRSYSKGMRALARGLKDFVEDA